MTHYYLHKITVCSLNYINISFLNLYLVRLINYYIFIIFLIYQNCVVDAHELSKLRTLYGYDLILKENLFNHLDFLQPYPFILNAILATCNGGTHANSILNYILMIFNEQCL